MPRLISASSAVSRVTGLVVSLTEFGISTYSFSCRPDSWLRATARLSSTTAEYTPGITQTCRSLAGRVYEFYAKR